MSVLPDPGLRPGSTFLPWQHEYDNVDPSTRAKLMLLREAERSRAINPPDMGASPTGTGNNAVAGFSRSTGSAGRATDLQTAIQQARQAGIPENTLEYPEGSDDLGRLGNTSIRGVPRELLSQPEFEGKVTTFSIDGGPDEHYLLGKNKPNPEFQSAVESQLAAAKPTKAPGAPGSRQLSPQIGNRLAMLQQQAVDPKLAPEQRQAAEQSLSELRSAYGLEAEQPQGGGGLGDAIASAGDLMGGFLSMIGGGQSEPEPDPGFMSQHTGSFPAPGMAGRLPNPQPQSGIQFSMAPSGTPGAPAAPGGSGGFLSPSTSTPPAQPTMGMPAPTPEPTPGMPMQKPLVDTGTTAIVANADGTFTATNKLTRESKILTAEEFQRLQSMQ